MELGEKDNSGRRRPVPTGEQFTEEFDNMLVAVSQTSDLALVQGSELETTRWNTITADSTTFSTNLPDVFAGGDVVLGPASVVQAVGQAYEAAISIDRYLKGENLAAGREDQPPLPAREYQTYVPTADRVKMRTQPAEKRVANFAEMELGFSEEEVIKEASRCLECGICSGCLQCEIVCEAGAILHDMKGEMIDIKVGSVIVATGAENMILRPCTSMAMVTIKM